MRVVVLCALAVATACAGNKAPKVVSARDQQRLEIESAKRQITEYLRAKNDSGLARLLSTDAILDLPSGDVLWSPGAIIQQLGYMRQLKFVDVTLSPASSVVCDEGAFEFGEYTARVRAAGADVDEVKTGGYRLAWKPLSDGSLRIHRIGLATSARKARAGGYCGSV